MSQQLLIETQLFEARINENNGKTLVSGVIQRAGSKNQNGRVYPRAILEREVKKYQTLINERRALGELDHPECFTDSAEIFTTDGWKCITDVTDSDIVFTLNTDGGVIETHKINATINQQYAGKMIKLKGKNINTTVTPNHKFLVQDRHGVYKFITAREIFELSKSIKVTHLTIPKTGKWVTDVFDNVIKLPSVSVGLRAANNLKEKYSKDLVLDSESFFAFLGFWFAEGGLVKRTNIHSGYAIRITQNDGDVANEFRDVLKQMSSELDYKEYKKVGSGKGITFQISDARLHSFLSSFGDVYTKRIPSFIKNSHPHLLEIFYDWFYKGDGSNSHYNGYDRKSVFSVSKGLVEDLNEILLKIGSAGVIKEQISTKDYTFAGRTIYTANKKTLYRLWHEKSKAIHLDFRFLDVEEVDYDGNIYCVTVPNETFYCRDNGKCFWTGNSSVINLKNVSHNITEIHWEGDNLVGTLEILTTPSGNIAKELLKSGITLGISSRGMGSTKDKGNGVSEVQSDFEILGWDLVSNPSTHGAYVRPVNEGVQHRQGQQCDVYCKAHDLMRDIIIELT